MTLQEELDLNGVAVVFGRQSPAAPLFLDGYRTLRGADGVAGFDSAGAAYGHGLDLHECGTAAVCAWPRGRVSDAHFTPDGFRSYHDAFPWGRGGEFDLGPVADGGWAAVRAVRFFGQMTRYSGSSWNGVVLGGINDHTPPNGLNPSPYVLHVRDGALRCEYALADGRRFSYVAAVDASAAFLEWNFTLDLEALHGPGSRLRPNTLWPFGVLRTPFQCNSTGRWGETGDGGVGNDPPDVLVTRFEVYATTAGGVRYQKIDRPARRPTYPGGPGLPLLAVDTKGNTRNLFAVHRSQGTADFASSIRVLNIDVTSDAQAPVLVLGACVGGGVQVGDLCRFAGGTRAVQSSRVTVGYPLLLSDSTFTNQSDAPVWLWEVSGCTLDRVQVNNPRRTYGEFVDSRVWVKGDCMWSPGGYPHQFGFEQYGGKLRAEEIAFDYEGGHRPLAGVRVRPGDFSEPYPNQRPTETRLDGVYMPPLAGVAVPAYHLDPPMSGYRGAVRVSVDGQTVYSQDAT